MVRYLRFLPAIALTVAAAIATTTTAAVAQEGAPAGEGSSALDALLRVAPPEQSGQCMTRQQSIAEQVMLVHTELLVTSLACDEPYPEDELLTRYYAFTMQHATAILDAQGELEQMMLGFGEEPQQAFDAYRTVMANGEVQILERWGTPTYCEMRRSRFDTLMAADEDAFNAYTLDLGLRAYSRQGGCGG